MLFLSPRGLELKLMLLLFRHLSASNIVTENINVRPDDGRQATVICDPEALQETDQQVGFVCHDGLYIKA
jgi:hypothetical protein